MNQINLGNGTVTTVEFVESNDADYNAYGGGYYKKVEKEVTDVTMWIKD